MKARIDTDTGEVLTIGHGRLRDDPQNIITIDQADIEKLLSTVDRDRRKLVYRGGTVTTRSTEEIEAIDARDTAIPLRRDTARTRLKSALNMQVVRQVKTLDHARAVIDAEVSDLDGAKEYLAKLLYTVIQTGRALESSDDDFFPPNE